MERGEEKGEDGVMGEEDNGIHEILTTGVNKPPAPFNKHQQERRPHGKPGPAPSDAVKLTIKHKVNIARSRCRPPAKGEHQEARFTDSWYLTGVREPHGAHSFPRDAHLNLWLTAKISTVLIPWLQLPLPYQTNRASERSDTGL